MNISLNVVDTWTYMRVRLNTETLSNWSSMEKLKNGARKLMKIYDRLNMVNEDKLFKIGDDGADDG